MQTYKFVDFARECVLVLVNEGDYTFAGIDSEAPPFLVGGHANAIAFVELLKAWRGIHVVALELI